ncbi:angiopoietin-related protein 3-like [Hydractinia symbiolongicarpus]|uniref:angiopoietin-related protein 3-like n=1 Tax=Hydractinia symbiolongicarpus TaxID=13093 RepID=UPI00254EA552|nr:angiopoietin-related protein 3-like [Hydractinia symbiolongicarpus]
MVTILFLFSACMYIISDCNTNGEFFTLTHSNRLRGTVLKDGSTSAIQCALRCNLDKACKEGGVVHISERENKCMMKNEKGGMFFEGKNTIVMTKTQLKKDHILVLRRVSDSVSFARTWFEYKHGFGNVKGNYWIGNEKLHEMSQRNVKLSIEFTRFNGEKYYAEYDRFQVENEGDQYRLNIGD